MTKPEAAKPAPKPSGKPSAETPAVEQGKAPAEKGRGILTYILFGVGGIALLAGVAFGTLFLLGGKKTAEVKVEDPHAKVEQVKPAESPKESNAEVTDSLTSSDSAVAVMTSEDSAKEIEEMVKNIEVMNQMNDSGVSAEANTLVANALPAEDSIKAVAWLTKRQDELTAKEKSLNARENDLVKREQLVSQKMIRIEQASSDRTTNLAKLYDGMDADAVAKLAANLDDSLLVTIIPKMKQKNASQLLALIPPPRAAKLSKQIITLAGD